MYTRVCITKGVSADEFPPTDRYNNKTATGASYSRQWNNALQRLINNPVVRVIKYARPTAVNISAYATRVSASLTELFFRPSADM